MDRVDPVTDQERELAELVVATLNLEIALAVSKKYGFQLRSDDSGNVEIFSALRSLNEHVQRHRTA